MFTTFCLKSHRNRDTEWCDWEGNPTSWAGPLPSRAMVSSAHVYASPRMLRFRDPSQFKAGNLTDSLHLWTDILADHPKKNEILSYISDGVNIFDFFTPFKGFFRGKAYDSAIPPAKSFSNAASCKGYGSFISKTIMERVLNGSLRIIGQVGACKPPHIVMPITIEPSKPRMCHDERYLNLWIRDCPLKLDYITDLIRYVEQDHHQTTFDDKSGYDHVRLHPNSSTFFGLEWQSWYFTYTTIPFGWKASAYIYHTIGLVATNHIRSLGVPCAQYIDDRHVGQLRLPQYQAPEKYTHHQLANMAAFIACSTLIDLGYFIGLKKSSLSPDTTVRFLGYLCDSHRQAFILPEDKRLKFAALRETILQSNTVSLKNLQKLSGKTTSFALLVPAAKLYTNAMYQAIAKAAAAKGKPEKIQLSRTLREEITHWRFLDTWDEFLPWRSEFHHQIQSFSDASNTGWGGQLVQNGEITAETRGYWDTQERDLPIAAKETLALLYTLQNLASNLHNTRVDVFVDNKVLVASWERQVSKSPTITTTLKSLFNLCASKNIGLALQYVPSGKNPADAASRMISDIDATLSQESWRILERSFGPHSMDLMALPTNARRDSAGRRLRFFSPWPCHDACGTNVFAHQLPPHENAYVFPPFVLGWASVATPLTPGLRGHSGCPGCVPKKILVANPGTKSDCIL